MILSISPVVIADVGTLAQIVIKLFKLVLSSLDIKPSAVVVAAT